MLNGFAYDFSVNCKTFDTRDIIDIYKNLMKKALCKMFGLTKKILVMLLTSLVSGSNNTKYVSLSNQKCMTQSTLLNLHPNEYGQELHYYPN